MGKGSRPRPYSVSSQEFDEAWDRIFGDKEKRQKLLDELASDKAD